MTLSDKINILMSERGINQMKLAKELKIQQASISRWFTQGVKPQRSRFPQIAKYFKVTVRCLVDDSLNIEYEGGRHLFAEEAPLTLQQQIDLQNRVFKEQGKVLKKIQMQVNALVKDFYGDPAKDLVNGMCSRNSKKKISKKS